MVRRARNQRTRKRKKFNKILVRTRGGDDAVRIDEANGVFTDTAPATLDGGAGNDTLLGGSGAETLLGGAGNDSADGGRGNDIARMGAGDDRFTWDPGEGSDVVEGGLGQDRMLFNGANVSETFDVSASGQRVRFLRNVGTIVINGGQGNDVLLGGDGNDAIDGGRGDDLALVGAGDDSFTWDPGEGSDILEGQGGVDKMVFNGANIGENLDVSANGGRARFVRNVGNVTMDLNDVEQIDNKSLGGADNLVVNDLSGTDVTRMNTDLGGADAQPDRVILQGTQGDDAIVAAGSAGSATVTGLAAVVAITGAEVSNDTLAINALAGDDVVEGSGLAADAIRFTADGGDGDDVLIGGAGNDALLGQAGDDVLLGGPGQDALDGGPGDNIVIQG